MPDSANCDDYRMYYKYVPFDEGTLRILTEGTIKYTHPSEFNGPYDCFPTYVDDPDDIGRGRRPMFDRAVDSYVAERGEKLNPAKRLIKRREFSRALQSQLDTPTWRAGVLRNVGVVSLSSVPNNMLMWSHYADCHRGFAVGFRITCDGLAATDIRDHGYQLLPHEVSYSKTRPQVSFAADSRVEQMEKMLLVKSRNWRYESEHRVIEVKRGPGIHSYNRDRVLSCVIAGMRMSEHDLETLRSTVQSLNDQPSLAHVKLFQTQASPKTFDLDIPGLGHPK